MTQQTNKKIKYEIKEATEFKEVVLKNKPKTIYGSHYLDLVPIKWNWKPIQIDFSEEMYKVCKEELNKGNCRNLKVVEVTN